MDKLVIDANILFFATLSRSNFTRNIFNKLLDNNIAFFSPDFIYAEVLKILLKLSEKKWISYSFHKRKIQEMLNYINIVDNFFYSDAISVVKPEIEKIDINDLDYVALAYKLNTPLWTNYKKLL